MRTKFPWFLAAAIGLTVNLATSLSGAVTNHVTTTEDSGPGSLRQAIIDLNAAGGGRILLSNLSSSIVLMSPLPSFEADTRLIGAGTNFPAFAGIVTFSISTQVVVRFSRIHFGNSNTFNNMGVVSVSQSVAPFDVKLMNYGEFYLAQASPAPRGLFSITGPGSTILEGQRLTRAILNGGNVEMKNCVISGSSLIARSGSTTPCHPLSFCPCGDFISSSPEPGLGGGLLISNACVELTACAILNNSVRGGNGISLCARRYGFVNAEEGAGGGIYCVNSILRMTNCVVAGNSVTAGGNSIDYWPPALGGGIYIRGGIGVLVGCTISSNRATGGGFASAALGAGVYADNAAVQILSCTITGNSSTPSPGGLWYNAFSDIPERIPAGIGVGGLSPSSNTVIQSSILVGNRGGEPAMNQFGFPFNVSGVANDAAGTIISMGRNLIGTTNPIITRWKFTNYNYIPPTVFTTNYYTRVTGVAENDMVGRASLLGPLEDNGGSIFTHALLAGSPAIDAGTNSGLAFDARGQPRTIDNPSVANAFGGDGTDIGAFEVNHILTGTETRRDGADILVKFTTVSSKTYGVESRPEVGDGSWTELPGTVTGTGGIVTYRDVNAASLPRRFYRFFERSR